MTLNRQPAASTILVRPHGKGFQVYLLKRSAESRFMPGAHVFPGGKVDPEDYGFDVRTNRSQTPLEETRPFIIAAIRETFEEAGVLLGERNRNRGPDLDSLLDLRRRGRLRPGWFSEPMREENRVPDGSGLFRWSHWITPRLMKHRYDTRFFLARMPENQTCTPDNRETSDGLWITPYNALAGNLSGEISLSPPALVILNELQGYPSMEPLMRAASKRSWGDVIEPRLVPLERGSLIIEPWDPMYGTDSIRMERSTFEEYILDPGEPFSRLWHDGRLWRPIRFQDRY